MEQCSDLIQNDLNKRVVRLLTIDVREENTIKGKEDEWTFWGVPRVCLVCIFNLPTDCVRAVLY